VALLSDAEPLVLGSKSSRRSEILGSVRVPFVVFGAEVDEAILPHESAQTYLVRITRSKLHAVLGVVPAASRAQAILVADTTVVERGAILGKPTDTGEAERMVARLAGRVHEVKTRFAVASREGDLLHEETVTTRVTFRALTARQVRAYAESGEGLDKAGGYAVQGLGAAMVSRIDGSYTNVVGLPACEVVVALTSLGFLE
jgi:septum formation protein